MRTIIGVMAAAMLFISVPARSAVKEEFFEHFNNGTYDTNCWTTQGDVSFDAGCCIFDGAPTNIAGLKLKVGIWQPPLEMRATMVENGELLFTVGSNCWVKFTLTSSEISWSAPSNNAARNPRPRDTTNDFYLFYNDKRLSVNAAGVLIGGPMPLTLVGDTIEFSSSNYLKLDLISVTLVPLPPSLSITPSEDHVVISWPTTSTVFKLESSADLGTASWVPVFDTPDVVNGTNVVSQRISGVRQFYRLAGFTE